MLLYIDVLQSLEKWNDIVDILSSPLGQLCKVPIDLKRMLISYQVKLEKWTIVHSLALEVLNEAYARLNFRRDDWQMYKVLINAAVKTNE